MLEKMTLPHLQQHLRKLNLGINIRDYEDDFKLKFYKKKIRVI